MNWIFTKKRISSDEYLELHKEISALKLSYRDLELELALILRKLKFKYKITKRDITDDDKTEDIKGSMLLPVA